MSFSVRKLKPQKKPSKSLGVLKGTLSATLKIIQVSGPLHNWYVIFRDRYEERKEERRRAVILKRILIVLVAILIALLFVIGTVKALVAINVIKTNDIAKVVGADLPRDEYGYVNLLLLGQGHNKHDGKDLTDTIIVASINPEEPGSVFLLSLPRDIYFLKTARMGKGPLNSMFRDFQSYLWYQKGIEKPEARKQALQDLGDEIGRKLGMEIHRTVKVDFQAFIEAVDELGGIDIDVPYEIHDTEYPDDNYGFELFHIDAGPQHMNGETALKYVRSRHTTSDFARSARQQQVLKAMAQKAKSEKRIYDPSFITSMLQSMQEHVETTMTVPEMVGLALLGKDIDASRLIAVQLSDRNALYDPYIEPGGMLYVPPQEDIGGFGLLPVSIPQFPVTWKQPQTLVDLIQENRELFLGEEPTINVLNNGAPSGTARKLAYELIRYGFEVDAIENADLPSKQETSAIFVQRIDESDPGPGPGPSEERETENNDYEEHLRFLNTLFDFEVTEKPEALPALQTNDITIILGKDYRYQAIQNLFIRK